MRALLLHESGYSFIDWDELMNHSMGIIERKEMGAKRMLLLRLLLQLLPPRPNEIVLFASWC